MIVMIGNIIPPFKKQVEKKHEEAKVPDQRPSANAKFESIMQDEKDDPDS